MQGAERTTIKIDNFNGAENEDLTEWLTVFEWVAITNRWTQEARKKAITGGHIKGAAADWFEGFSVLIGNYWNTRTNVGNNFVD